MKWLGSLLWCEFSSWPRNVVGAAPTKQNKQTKNQNAHRDLNQECYLEFPLGLKGIGSVSPVLGCRFVTCNCGGLHLPANSTCCRATKKGKKKKMITLLNGPKMPIIMLMIQLNLPSIPPFIIHIQSIY